MKNNLQHIHRVDIEPQSYCNRQCDWCPNKTFDRTFKDIMSDEVYSSIIKQLFDAGFNNADFHKTAKLHFLGYQEPLSDVDLLKKRIEEARSVFGDIPININTNGDYLTKEILEGLDITSLSIQDYDCRGKQYWINKLNKCGVLGIRYNLRSNRIQGYTQFIKNINVVLNWSKTRQLENRGGYFKQGDLPEMNWVNNMNPRIAPCPEPEYFINIYFDGSVTPCCHIRPDNPEHQEYILGNANDTPLVDIYYSEKAENFRKKLREPNGDYPEPCKYCQKMRNEICVGSPSGWDYYPDKYKEV